VIDDGKPQNAMEVDETDDTDEIVIDVLDEISRRLGTTYSGFVDCGGCIGSEIRCFAPLLGVPFIPWIILISKLGSETSDLVCYNRNSIPS
jgi:hypothetical protein